MTYFRAVLRFVSLPLVAAAMIPSGAAASTIALADNPQTGGKFVDYSAAPGETNQLTGLGLVQSRFLVQDGFGAVSITPTQPCTSGIPGENMETRFASCPSDSLEFVFFDLGDGDDQGSANFGGPPFVISGGDGADNLIGGDSDDELYGDADADVMLGEPGSDLLDGGAGADELMGGDDFDLADYTERTAPVTATLNGAADDGTAGEGDRIGTDVESIDGGSAGDRLTGDAGENGLFGEAGPDTLDGGAGADRLEGDSGDDTILARDGVADQINCGTGSDSAAIDNKDTVVGCETVLRPATPPDTTPPQLLGSLSITPRAFRAAPRGPSVAAAVTGARVKYRLSENASVRFTVHRAHRGVRRGGRCLKRRRGARGRQCTRYVRLRGSFTHAGKLGEDSFRFTGRLRGRKLRPGRYRLVATPRDAAANRGNPVRAKFRIVR